MPSKTLIQTLRDAAQALRHWLNMLDGHQVGQIAACHIDLAAYLLEEEALASGSRAAPYPPLPDTCEPSRSSN